MVPANDDLTQAAAQSKTAGATRYDTACRALPGAREGRIIDWLRGVSRDSRIGVLHRLAPFAAMSPHFDVPSHLREFAETLAKRIRRDVGKARAEGGLGRDFIFGVQRGGTA